MTKPVSALLLVALSASAAGQLPQEQEFAMTPISGDAFTILSEFFRYDASVPLDARVVERIERPESVREKVVFRGFRNSRVPAYLDIPSAGEPPYPCVILVHGIGGSKEGWWLEGASHSGELLTDGLLAAGFSVLALDAEYHGERLVNNDYESAAVFLFERNWMQRVRDMIVQSVVEHRRAIDVLASREDIDTSRLGVVGYSMGGMVSFMLPAVEPRVSAAVSCVPPLVRESHSPIAIHNYASRIENAAFLTLVAEADPQNITPEEAQRLHELIGTPSKEIEVYAGGHILPVEWTDRAIDWLKSALQ